MTRTEDLEDCKSLKLVASVLHFLVTIPIAGGFKCNAGTASSINLDGGISFSPRFSRHV